MVGVRNLYSSQIFRSRAVHAGLRCMLGCGACCVAVHAGLQGCSASREPAYVGWGFSSVETHLPGMSEALSAIPRTEKQVCSF